MAALNEGSNSNVVWNGPGTGDGVEDATFMALSSGETPPETVGAKPGKSGEVNAVTTDRARFRPNKRLQPDATRRSQRTHNAALAAIYGPVLLGLVGVAVTLAFLGLPGSMKTDAVTPATAATCFLASVALTLGWMPVFAFIAFRKSATN